MNRFVMCLRHPLRFLCLAAAACATDAPPASPGPVSPVTVYVVPHSHIDIEWKWTYDFTQRKSREILDAALALMRRDPRYCFAQDQVLAIKPWWDALSEADRAFARTMIAEGRLEIVGGMYVMPEFVEPGGEATVRQLLHGKPWMERELGARVRVAWNIDSFGQDRQLPQLFRQAGLDAFVFSRGGLNETYRDRPNVFEYEGLDGTKIVTCWLAAHYSCHGDVDRVARGLREIWKHDRPSVGRYMLLWGDDLYVPAEDSAEIERIVRAAAVKAHVPLKEVVIATPSRFFDAVRADGATLPVLDTDFNPPLGRMDLRGTVSNRIEIKQAFRRCETALLQAEKLAALAAMVGRPAEKDDLHEAWQDLLFNANHDNIGGSHIDAVYHGTMERFGRIDQRAGTTLRSAGAALAGRLSGQTGETVLVLNTLSFPRSEIVRHAAADGGDVTPVDGLGPAAAASEVKDDPAACEWVARDVPPLGYVQYRMDAAGGAQARHKGEQAVDGLLALGGALMTALNGGDPLILEAERAPELEGVLSLTGRALQEADEQNESSGSSDAIARGEWLREGPFAGGRIRRSVTMRAHASRIEYTTSFYGFTGVDGLLEACFPCAVGGKPLATWAETAFGVTRRPLGEAYPCQTWVLVESEHDSIAFFNRGIPGYWLRDDGVMRLQLMRSITNYKGYDAPLAAEKGDHTFEYAIVPHGPDWREGNLVEMAHSYNTPLLTCRVAPGGQGTLPPRFSFLSVEQGTFEITALKRAEDGDGFVLRGYETRGRACDVRLKLNLPVRRAWRSDILEGRGGEMPVRDGALEFRSRPFEVVTLRLAT